MTLNWHQIRTVSYTHLALIEAEKIAIDDVVICPVYQKGNAVMQRTGVENVEYHSVAINRYFKNTTKN